MTERGVSIPCGDISLEGALHTPDGPGPFPTVVVCHPHPLFGGSMDNNVVMAVCAELCRTGTAALRFNFRGVGRSGGMVSGVGDPDDVRAALSFAASLPEVDGERLGVCGYSAGAIAAFSQGPADPQIKAAAAISPPLAMSGLEVIATMEGPALVVSGSGDDFTPAENVRRFCEALPRPSECHIVDGADHFWWGFERQVGDVVASFFSRSL